MTRTCSAVTFSALLHLFFTSNYADFMTGGRGRTAKKFLA